jgi:hypothetical protein
VANRGHYCLYDPSRSQSKSSRNTCIIGIDKGTIHVPKLPGNSRREHCMMGLLILRMRSDSKQGSAGDREVTLVWHAYIICAARQVVIAERKRKERDGES